MFARLLGDYERASCEEATAIAERNFDALTFLHRKKLLLLEGLIVAAGGRNQGPEAQSRLDALSLTDHQNQERLKSELSQIQAELSTLNEASLRLRSVKNVYRPLAADTMKTGFFARV